MEVGYLTCNSTFEKYRRVVIDEAEVLEHTDPLLIIREKLQVLIGKC